MPSRLATCCSVFSLSFLLLACAGSDQVASTPADSDSLGHCALPDSQIRIVSENALDRLIRDWPVLDRECESFSLRIRRSETNTCQILGGPNKDPGCEAPAHTGYIAEFDPGTLEATRILWLSR